MVGLRGAGGVKNFCVWISDGTPLTARSSFNPVVSSFFNVLLVMCICFVAAPLYINH